MQWAFHDVSSTGMFYSRINPRHRFITFDQLSARHGVTGIFKGILGRPRKLTRAACGKSSSIQVNRSLSLIRFARVFTGNTSRDPQHCSHE
jgi:hypothetical protein